MGDFSADGDTTSNVMAGLDPAIHVFGSELSSSLRGGEADEAIQPPACLMFDLDCFAERVIGPAKPDPLARNDEERSRMISHSHGENALASSAPVNLSLSPVAQR